MEEEKLFEAVRTFPCLWQVKSPVYKDIRAKENAWNKVAIEVRKLNTLVPFSIWYW